MISKIAFFLIFLSTVLLVIIYPPFELSPAKIYDKRLPLTPKVVLSATAATSPPEECDLFTGEWIPNPERPYYTNETCVYLHQYQNCLQNERPNTDHLKWRWKPDGCELPKFDLEKFIELVRGKSIAFIGDSMSRNQMQSLICLLPKGGVAEAFEDSRDGQFWVYKQDYNFNMSLFWSPFMVRTEKPEPDPERHVHNLYVDEFDEYWTSKIEGYNFIFIAFGQWYIHNRFNFYENHRLFGCHICNASAGLTDVGFYVGYRKAYRTALKAINLYARPGAKIFVRTVSPSHYEGGPWDGNGRCERRRPYGRNETVVLPTEYSIMREIEMEEFKIAEKEGRKRGLRYALLDVTMSMLMRPDGHPGKYVSGESTVYDCLHWCLPGPVDLWNELALQLLLKQNL